MLESVKWNCFLRPLFLSLLSGILLFLGFPKFNLSFLAWIAFIPLLFALQNLSLKNSLYCGWLTGLTYFLGTVYWVTITMVTYGKIPPVLSILLMLILVVYLALYPALFAFFVRWLSLKFDLSLVYTAPCLWTALEYARGHLLTGFPWVSLGYSQYQSLMVIQIADITSVYGVSFLIVMVNALLYEWSVSLFTSTTHLSMAKGRPWGPFVITLLLVTFTFVYGYYRLFTPQRTTPRSTVRIAVVQGNIEQDKKWDQRYQRETLGTYLRLTQEALASPADLVVWPEAATPFLFNQNPEYEREITQLAQTYSTPILFGSPSLSMLQKGEPTLLNSAYLISSAGQVINRYDKIHLVPFGEYVPLSSVLSFVNKLVEGIGEFIPGKDYTLMDLPQAKFGVVICFEVIFPELVRNFVAEGAQFMTTITNDAWFGTSSAPYQHFSMVVFRAIENRVPFARAANTGISGFIDSRGEILKTSRLFEEVTLKGDLRITGEKTLYTQYGDLFAIICVILSFILLIRPLMKSPKKKGTKHAR